jgi:YaiO family outer membrane protein
MPGKNNFLFFFLFIVTGSPFSKVFAQEDTLKSDGLFQAARKAAFDEKNYTKAKSYLYKALNMSPDYNDIWIFLGRIYTWTDNYDSAKICFTHVLANKPDYEDASIAYTDLAYWNDRYDTALNVCVRGLQYHPSSEELLLRKAKILSAMKRYPAADSVVQQILLINKNNTQARLLHGRIKELSVKNKINVGYDFVYFDKEFTNPWHLASIDYGRSTKLGTITGRFNYANRFAESSTQFELEAYPRISKTFYSYAELGFSNNNGVFPRFRTGFSLYSNLPHSFEGELGFRYLQFSGTPTWIYTAYLGKYYKSWLFGARTYITPSTYTNVVSASYTALARYYYGSADDFIGFSAGYGISPDDRYNSVQLNSGVRLTSYNLSVLFKKKITRTDVFTVSANWANQEYLPDTKGNQYQAGVAWQHRF